MTAQQMIINEAAMEEAVIRKIVDTLPAAIHEAVHSFLTGVTGKESERTVQNGVREPKKGGKCYTIWTELDKLTKGDKIPSLQQVFELAERKKWNANNARIEYYQWRRFHGYGAVVQALKK